MMKSFSIALLFLVQSLFAEYQFKIQPKKHLLSTYYDIYSDDRSISTIKREHLQFNTIYSVRGEMGESTRGIAKFFSLGTLSKSLRQIKLYDESNQRIGSIKGTILTTAKGKFTFYNHRKKPLAKAYIDRSGSSITIVSSSDKWNLYALFRKVNLPQNGESCWEVRVFDEYALDPSMLYIFGAFVSDSFWPEISDEENAVTWESLTEYFKNNRR